MGEIYRCGCDDCKYYEDSKCTCDDVEIGYVMTGAGFVSACLSYEEEE